MSTLTPLLASHGVKNVAVGLEDFGLDDFVKGEFFNGDLYVDIDKKSYKDIGYKRFSTVGVILSLFSKKSRDRISQVCNFLKVFKPACSLHEFKSLKEFFVHP